MGQGRDGVHTLACGKKGGGVREGRGEGVLEGEGSGGGAGRGGCRRGSQECGTRGLPQDVVRVATHPGPCAPVVPESWPSADWLSECVCLGEKYGRCQLACSKCEAQ